MPTDRVESFAVPTANEVVGARHLVRRCAIQIGFSLVEQTKIVTAASELARNMVDYGRGGVMHVDLLDDGTRKGLKLTFEDKGPGIPDIQQALRDGFTSGSGMGLGLGGAKRLSNEFSVVSEVGQGTTVTIVRWKGST